MTYTVLGRCHRTGRVGIGIATFSITVGRYCWGVKSNAGVTVSQAFANERNNALALRLLTQGFTARSVLQQLMENDPYAEYRQIGVIDRSGTAVAHTGPHTRGWSGHQIDADCVAFGNGLVGPQVLAGLISGFLARPDDALEYRLMQALEAGRDAGGQGNATTHKPERSAAIKVVDRLDYPDIDVRVDVHPTAVEELRRVLEEFKLYEEFYRERGRHPSKAIPQDVFVANLKARRA